MLSSVDRTWRKGFVRISKTVNNETTNWHTVGDLDTLNDRKLPMMECPNLVFVEEHLLSFSTPHKVDKKVLDYDNISFQIYKIVGLPLTLKMPK